MPTAASCSPIQRAVRVDDLAEQQLGPDRQDVAAHARILRMLVLQGESAPRFDPAAAHDVERREHVNATATQTRSTCRARRASAVGGKSTHPDREHLDERLPLAPLARRATRCPVGPRASGTTETNDLTRRHRARPGSHHDVAAHDRARRTRRAMRTLSASGSRNAPDRVVPSRRATHPSTPSVTREHEPEPDGEPRRALVASMSTSVGIASSSRTTVIEVRRRRDRGRPEPALRMSSLHVHRRTAPGATEPPVAGDGLEVGTERAGDLGGDDRARPGDPAPRRRTTPSISGASRCVRPTRVAASVSTPDRRGPRRSRRSARRAPSRVIGSCTLAALAEPLRGQGSAVDGRPSSRPAVPSSAENGKKPAQSSRGRGEEREQRVVVALGLAREADDERRAERGVGLGGADALDDLEEPVAAPPSLHPRSSGARGVLERQVEVRDDGRELEHRGDERVADLARVEVEEADAREPVARRAGRAGAAAARASRARRRRGRTRRGPARRARARPRRASTSGARLGLDRLGRARPLRAPERRDRAERAGAVAALGDLHVGPRAPTARAGAARAGRGRRWACGRRARPRASEPSPREADDGVGLGQRRRRARRRSARPCSRSRTSRAPGLRSVGERRGSTSIDSWRAASTNAQVLTTTRSASRPDRRGIESVGQQRGDDLVGVDGVLRAAQGLDVVAAAARTHRLQAGVTAIRSNGGSVPTPVDGRSRDVVGARVGPGRRRVRRQLRRARRGRRGVLRLPRRRAVVDVWCGTRRPRRSSRPWRATPSQLVFSTTKGATAMCAHLLVAARRARPRRAGRRRTGPSSRRTARTTIPLRWVLSHRAGLAAIDGDLTLDEALAWDPVVAALAAQAPNWEPGTAHGYHMRSYGWLVGEVVRRVDRPHARSVLRRGDRGAARPRLLDRAARRGGARASTSRRAARDETSSRRSASVRTPPDTMPGRGHVGTVRPVPLRRDVEHRALHAAELPSSNGIADGAARSRACTRRPSAPWRRSGAGVRLLDAATVADATDGAVRRDRRVIGFPMRIASWASWLRAHHRTASQARRAFGHPGAGGSLGFADPEAGLGFGYVMNRMVFGDLDPRADLLAAAAYRARG